MEKNKFGVSDNHFWLYIIAFSLGVGILLVLLAKLSSLWQGIITNVGAGLIITSLFAFWIDRINNINQSKRIKQKQQITLRELEYYLHYICDLHVRVFNMVKVFINQGEYKEDYLKNVNNVKNVDDSILFFRNIISNLLLNVSPVNQDISKLKRRIERLLQKNKERLEKVFNNIITFDIKSLYINDIITNEHLQMIESLYMPLQDSIDFYLEYYYHNDLFNIIYKIQQMFEFKRLPTLEKLKENLNTK